MHALVLAFVFLLTPAAFAQERPFDMNGIVLGSELAAVERTSRFACSESRSAVADQLCRLKPGEKETLADAPVKGMFLYYYAGKLEMITVTLEPKDFPDVVAALTKKYGTGSLESETVRNVTGTAFENKIYSWRRGAATLEAQTYGRSLDTSSVIYRTDFSLEEYTRRSKAKQ